jgi:hypothetical protein
MGDDEATADFCRVHDRQRRAGVQAWLPRGWIRPPLRRGDLAPIGHSVPPPKTDGFDRSMVGRRQLDTAGTINSTPRWWISTIPRWGASGHNSAFRRGVESRYSTSRRWGLKNDSTIRWWGGTNFNVDSTTRGWGLSTIRPFHGGGFIAIRPLEGGLSVA